MDFNKQFIAGDMVKNVDDGKVYTVYGYTVDYIELIVVYMGNYFYLDPAKVVCVEGSCM